MNTIYEQLIKDIKREPKIKFLMARIFGKKCQFTDPGYRITTYFFRQQIYVTKFEKKLDTPTE